MPNDDLISRKALLEHLRTILMSDVFYDWINMEMHVKCSVGILGERFRREIESAPAVDAKRVLRGEWIEKPYLLGTTRYCSRCGANYGMPHGVFNYCPSCGAKMED